MSSVTVINFEKKPSTQMRAVLLVLEADPHLRQAIFPFIDLNLETIYWGQIFKMSLCSGHRTVVGWLYGIWTDEPRPRSNVFDGSLNLSPKLQTAILKALALRWGLAA